MSLLDNTINTEYAVHARYDQLAVHRHNECVLHSVRNEDLAGEFSLLQH